MNHLLFSLMAAILVSVALPAIGQPVVKTDAVALIKQLPAPPVTLADAYQRAYPGGVARADAKPYYQASTDRLHQVQQEAQHLLLKFYEQHPTGVPDLPKQSANRVSAQHRSAMDAATSELAQKMLTDPAFAKQFAQMSESEQHAYIAKSLADKGLKPAQGVPNTPETPMPGTDVDWLTPCTEFTQPAFAMARWQKQTALQQQYAARHDTVNAWAEAEIKKLPMISFGEYGHDHDPAQVQAIRKQALSKHRDVANQMTKDAAAMFTQFRHEAEQRSAPLNDALKKASYGEGYSFGLHYTLVLQTQTAMLGDVQTLLTNEMNLIEEIAQWEHEWRNFEATGR